MPPPVEHFWDRLEALAQRLQEQRGIQAQIVTADLTKPDDLKTVERLVADEPFDVLINNAGFAGYMPFVQLDSDRAEVLIRLQVIAPTRLTRAALPGMIARGRGTVINVSSALAFSGPVPSAAPAPKRAVYAGTKAYLNTFTEILHHELEGTGVHVQALCPGVVCTESKKLQEWTSHSSPPRPWSPGILWTPRWKDCGCARSFASRC